MIIKPNIIEAVNSLVSAKQRSILALIGIVVGIGSVIAMVSVGSIVQKEALRQFMEMGTDVITISEGFSGDNSKKAKKLSIQTAIDIPDHCPSITTVAPYASAYAQFKFKGKKDTIPAMGVTPSFLAINKLNIDSGRFIHELDRHMFYCVIGQKVADKLAAQGVYDPVGTCIFFKEKHVTIIGKIREAPMGGMRPYEINEGIMLPLSTLQRLDREAAIRNIIARSRDNAVRDQIESEVNAYLFQQNFNGMKVRTAEELIAQMQKQMKLFTLLLGTIGSISLVVGGIGVMNVMLVSVTERTKEIGIRRALGAREGDILLQFLVESVLLCSVGGFVGITIGVGASWVISYYAKWQFAVSYNSIGLGVAVAVAVGIFFGIYPARQAARLSPILALRSD